jgi:hypothetical protein
VTAYDDRALEFTIRQLGQRADAPSSALRSEPEAHVDEPILALLRGGDHDDDLADAVAHVARCVDCRARLTAGELGSRALVVVAIEAPRNSQSQLRKAAEGSHARLLERGHGRWTAVVDADQAEKLKAELVKGETSVVTRLVVSTPLEVPREGVPSSRGPMPSMFDMVPRQRGTEAAEVHAWGQMRRQPKQKVGGASPGWALFAIAAVGGAVGIAYFLATR